jgi:hypothetical protein
MDFKKRMATQVDFHMTICDVNETPDVVDIFRSRWFVLRKKTSRTRNSSGTVAIPPNE